MTPTSERRGWSAHVWRTARREHSAHKKRAEGFVHLSIYVLRPLSAPRRPAWLDATTADFLRSFALVDGRTVGAAGIWLAFQPGASDSSVLRYHADALLQTVLKSISYVAIALTHAQMCPLFYALAGLRTAHARLAGSPRHRPALPGASSVLQD